MNAFSWARLIALLRKESIQILRDAMTLRFIIAIPLMQLFLFGYAINSDPKHLPAGLLSIEDSKYTRTIAAALNNSGYYNLRIVRSRPRLTRGSPGAISCSSSRCRPTSTGRSIAASRRAC